MGPCPADRTSSTPRTARRVASIAQGEYIFEYIQRSTIIATSVHIPQALLDAVDRKARALRISRNRLIIEALERELASGGNWTPGFFDRLADVDDDTASAVEDLRRTVIAARGSKRPVRLKKP